MRVSGEISLIRGWIESEKKAGHKVGFVPTMGFLHEGHLTLIRRAEEDCDIVVVSIFVNPAQFGRGEDLEKYPRDLERDIGMCENVGVDIVFNPEVDEMYQKGFGTYVDVEGVASRLEGERRPGHFRGVTTVVAKLFNIVQPDTAYFGQKDYQQLLVVRKMVVDLNFPIEIVGVQTAREFDGLALSSRNTYLNPEERRAAIVLSKSLTDAREMYRKGVRDAGQIRNMLTRAILSEPLARIDYISVSDPVSLEELETITDGAVILLAVKIGNTRLIDNILLA